MGENVQAGTDYIKKKEILRFQGGDAIREIPGEGDDKSYFAIGRSET